jgi:sec-independent protein translocase protein TatA
MDFLGVGPAELIVILIIALIVLGPRRLPEVGRAVGKTLRDFRNMSQDLTSELTQELSAATQELKAVVQDASEPGQAAQPMVTPSVQPPPPPQEVASIASPAPPASEEQDIAG